MTEPASEESQTAWVSIAAPPGGGTHMRLRDADGRVVVDEVYIHGPEITATTLQGIPVSSLLLAANLIFPVGVFDVAAMIKYGDVGGPPVHERSAAGDPSLAELRAWAEDAPSELALPAAHARDPLTRPDGTDPDGFSARVADAYREYAMQTRAPAIKIAEEADVPVATARSWIREARRRGHLPQGQRGKAG